MDDFPLFEIAAVASVLSAGFAIVGLFVAAICIFFPRQQSVSIKLLGSLMVLALAFAANNVAVYSLAIFIVATLVTDLDFLEKIAALFWNRDKYWEYRMGQIPPSEVKARVASEAQQEAEAESSTTTETGVKPEKERLGPSAIKSFVADALSFERAVNNALAAGHGPFAPTRIITNRRLRSSSGAVELDAIVETPSADYVVEIKYSKRPHVLLNALAAVERGAGAYRAYLNERGIVKEVIPVAVIPAGVSAPSLFRGVMPVLQFNSTEQEFVNQEEFLTAVRTRRETNA
ncbi:MAG: hypothetical protein IH604_15525 [Burkholderiales bacterium]|nr:hypothetical protein [Burkholderiales bacterium]